MIIRTGKDSLSTKTGVHRQDISVHRPKPQGISQRYLMWSAHEHEINLEHWPRTDPDETTECGTVRKPCEATARNFSQNSGDQILVAKFFSPTECDSRGKKVGSRNTNPEKLFQ